MQNVLDTRHTSEIFFPNFITTLYLNHITTLIVRQIRWFWLNFYNSKVPSGPVQSLSYCMNFLASIKFKSARPRIDLWIWQPETLKEVVIIFSLDIQGKFNLPSLPAFRKFGVKPQSLTHSVIFGLSRLRLYVSKYVNVSTVTEEYNHLLFCQLTNQGDV